MRWTRRDLCRRGGDEVETLTMTLRTRPARRTPKIDCGSAEIIISHPPYPISNVRHCIAICIHVTRFSTATLRLMLVGVG